jgi:SAM-dependent methyltransferase
VSEVFLRAFHATHAGKMSKAFVRGGSYDRLAALLPASARVLDLGCGDGALLERLGPQAVGIDLSRDELVLARGRVAQARAQELPIADGSIDICTCHLAFMLFDEPERVVAELARVLAPGGEFVAVLGGGPVASGEPDAFHRFLTILDRAPRAAPRFGDPRTRNDVGWRELFAGWRIAPFERWELDLGGSFDDVWSFLSASYELASDAEQAVRDELYRAVGQQTACRVVVFLARAVKKARSG